MISWIGFLVKWIAATIAFLFLGIFFPLEGTLNFFHALVLGLLFAAVGTIADAYVIYKLNRFAATIVDMLLGAIVAWVGNAVFYAMNVTPTFVVLAGVLLGFIECFLHFLFVHKPKRLGNGDYPGNGPI